MAARRSRRAKPGITVKVSGADPKHLKEQGEKFQLHYNRTLWRMAIVPTANLVERIMKSFASVDTEFMRETIEQKETTRKNRATIKIRPNYRLYDEYFYAPVQEYGSEKRNIPAVGFVQRARQAGRSVYARLVEKASNRAIGTYRPMKAKDAA